jgi:hypothetical protein
MKIQDLILGFACMILPAIAGCESNGLDDGTDDTVYEHEYRTDEVLYPPNSKLKRVLQVYPDDSTNEICNYEYDRSGRISKENSLFGYYGLYEYDAKNQLTAISYFSVNAESTTPPVLNRKHIYKYDKSGNKTRETIERYGESKQSEYTLYKYKNKKLVRSEHYASERFEFYRLYEYNHSNELIKEYFSVPNVNEEPVTTEHTYKDGLLVYSITYSGSKTNLMWDSRKIYDMNDHLIIEINNTPGLSSAIPPTAFYDTRRYEY